MGKVDEDMEVLKHFFWYRYNLIYNLIYRGQRYSPEMFGNFNGITVTKIFRIRGFSSSFHEVESR